jgi:hypothetical protein
MLRGWLASRSFKPGVRLRQGYGGRCSLRFSLRSKAKAGAGEGIRTLDFLVGNEMLYH